MDLPWVYHGFTMGLPRIQFDFAMEISHDFGDLRRQTARRRANGSCKALVQWLKAKPVDRFGKIA